MNGLNVLCSFYCSLKKGKKFMLVLDGIYFLAAHHQIVCIYAFEATFVLSFTSLHCFAEDECHGLDFLFDES